MSPATRRRTVSPREAELAIALGNAKLLARDTVLEMLYSVADLLEGLPAAVVLAYTTDKRYGLCEVVEMQAAGLFKAIRDRATVVCPEAAAALSTSGTWPPPKPLEHRVILDPLWTDDD